MCDTTLIRVRGTVEDLRRECGTPCGSHLMEHISIAQAFPVAQWLSGPEQSEAFTCRPKVLTSLL